MNLARRALVLSLAISLLASQTQLFAHEVGNWVGPRGEVQSEELLKGLVGVTLTVTPVKNGEQRCFLSCKVTISNLTNGAIVFPTTRAKEPVIIYMCGESFTTDSQDRKVATDPGAVNMTIPDSQASNITIKAKSSKVYEFMLQDRWDRPLTFSAGKYQIYAEIPVLPDPTFAPGTGLAMSPTQTLVIQ